MNENKTKQQIALDAKPSKAVKAGAVLGLGVKANGKAGAIRMAA